MSKETIRLSGDLIVTDDVSAANMELMIHGFSVEADGYAKKHPVDTPDPEVGRLLSIARALDKLSAQLHERADQKVRHNDRLASQRQGLERVATEFGRLVQEAQLDQS